MGKNDTSWGIFPEIFGRHILYFQNSKFFWCNKKNLEMRKKSETSATIVMQYGTMAM